MSALAARRTHTDVLFGLLLAVWGQLELWWSGFVFTVDPNRRPMWLLTLCQLGMTAPVAIRRRVPLTALSIAMGALAVEQLATAPADTVASLVGLLVLTGTAAARCGGREAAAAAAVTVAGLCAMAVERGGETLFLAVLLGAAATAGRAVRSGILRVGALETRAAQLERERDERARAAAVEERFRIARELHDLVAHHVSGLVVQAGAARQVVRSDPDRAVEALLLVEQSGREALDEMRHLLGVLRGGEGDQERAPQPRLERVEEMAERLRSAGMDVRVEVAGTPRPLPAAIDLSAFRIVQEALTNACKHSTPTTIRVRIDYLPDAVELEVTNDGVAIEGTSDGGHGIAGMRERVALYGGRLAAGSRPEGGYCVQARLPVGPA
jgi:signal transduction histidine kinase